MTNLNKFAELFVDYEEYEKYKDDFPERLIVFMARMNEHAVETLDDIFDHEEEGVTVDFALVLFFLTFGLTYGIIRDTEHSEKVQKEIVDVAQRVSEAVTAVTDLLNDPEWVEEHKDAIEGFGLFGDDFKKTVFFWLHWQLQVGPVGLQPT